MARHIIAISTRYFYKHICYISETELSQSLIRREYDVLLTSPEMVLGNNGFAKLVRDPDFMKDCVAAIVDEVHCISQWGDKFRKLYAELQTLRSYVPRSVPFLAASATLPPAVLSDIKTTRTRSVCEPFEMRKVGWAL